MRTAGNASAHVAVALIGAILCAAIPLAPGVARLAASAFAVLQAELPSAATDRARARAMALPEGTYPRAHMNYGKDETRLSKTELEWAR